MKVVVCFILVRMSCNLSLSRLQSCTVQFNANGFNFSRFKSGAPYTILLRRRNNFKKNETRGAFTRHILEPGQRAVTGNRDKTARSDNQ